MISGDLNSAVLQDLLPLTVKSSGIKRGCRDFGPESSALLTRFQSRFVSLVVPARGNSSETPGSTLISLQNNEAAGPGALLPGSSDAGFSLVLLFIQRAGIGQGLL